MIPQASIEGVIFISDLEKVRKEEKKIKGPKWPECKYNDVCEGPWKVYAEIFGWGGSLHRLKDKSKVIYK